MVVTGSYTRTDTSAMWDQVAPQLGARLEPVQKVVETGFYINVAIISGGTSLGVVGGTTLGLRGGMAVATGFTTKAAARAAVDSLVASPAAKAAAKNLSQEQQRKIPSRL